MKPVASSECERANNFIHIFEGGFMNFIEALAFKSRILLQGSFIENGKCESQILRWRAGRKEVFIDKESPLKIIVFTERKQMIMEFLYLKVLKISLWQPAHLPVFLGIL